MKQFIPGNECEKPQGMMVGLLRSYSVFICHLGLTGEEDCEKMTILYCQGRKKQII